MPRPVSLLLSRLSAQSYTTYQDLTYSEKASERVGRRNSPLGPMPSSYTLQLSIFLLRETFVDSPTPLPVSCSCGLIGPSYSCALKVALSHLASDGSVQISALLRQFYSTHVYGGQMCAQACLCQAQWVNTKMNQTQPQRTYSQWGRQTLGTDTIN